MRVQNIYGNESRGKEGLNMTGNLEGQSIEDMTRIFKEYVVSFHVFERMIDFTTSRHAKLNKSLYKNLTKHSLENKRKIYNVKLLLLLYKGE